jgi:hypothetical protein
LVPYVVRGIQSACQKDIVRKISLCGRGQMKRGAEKARVTVVWSRSGIIDNHPVKMRSSWIVFTTMLTTRWPLFSAMSVSV